MTQAAKAQEPSMEEILASIRRIIADDDGSKPKAEAKPEPKPEAKPAAKAPPPPPKPGSPASAATKQDDIDAMLAGLSEPSEQAAPPPAAPATEPEAADVLELTEAMQTPAAPAFRKIDGQQDVVFDETAIAEAPRRPDPPHSAPHHSRRSSQSPGSYPRQRQRPSIPRSMRLPKQCWCKTPRRWKIW